MKQAGNKEHEQGRWGTKKDFVIFSQFGPHFTGLFSNPIVQKNLCQELILSPHHCSRQNTKVDRVGFLPLNKSICWETKTNNYSPKNEVTMEGCTKCYGNTGQTMFDEEGRELPKTINSWSEKGLPDK